MKLTPYVLALSYTAINEPEIIKLIVGSICAIILLAGIIMGCWNLFRGFTSENQDKTNFGIVSIIVGIVIPGVIYSVTEMII